MTTKKYTSYDEIQQELKILKLEKEINYNKIKFNFEKTKENILPTSAVSIVGNLYSTVFSGTSGTILKTIIPFIINWLLNKKRGN